MTRRILIFHDLCPDGLLAAYITREALEESDPTPVILHPAKYGSLPPDGLRGARVFMVDFSYKRPVLEGMLADCESMVILDHHDSAEKELAGLTDRKLVTVFDMNRSGAGLAWDIYHSGMPRPTLVSMIEDADLWRWKVPRSKEIGAAFRALRFAFGMDACRIAFGLTQSSDGLDAMAAMGAHILQLRQQIIDGYVSNAEHVAFHIPDGSPAVDIWAVECPPDYASDIGHALCEKPIIVARGDGGDESAEVSPSFSATYRKDGDIYRVSLRSLYPKSGAHVGAIARQYGGGGHPPAAGFECKTRPWEMVE